MKIDNTVKQAVIRIAEAAASGTAPPTIDDVQEVVRFVFQSIEDLDTRRAFLECCPRAISGKFLIDQVRYSESITTSIPNIYFRAMLYRFAGSENESLALYGDETLNNLVIYRDENIKKILDLIVDKKLKELVISTRIALLEFYAAHSADLKLSQETKPLSSGWKLFGYKCPIEVSRLQVEQCKKEHQEKLKLLEKYLGKEIKPSQYDYDKFVVFCKQNNLRFLPD